MRNYSIRRTFEFGILSLFLATGLLTSSGAAEVSTLRVLFLGDKAGHRPSERFAQLEPVLRSSGIDVDYTDSLDVLHPAKLAGYDALMIYANHERIQPGQEQALLDFVAGGGGLVALHCASYCFHNSPRYIELVGAQFQRHGTGEFEEVWVTRDHPVLEGLAPIRSWDETYVHTRHNPDRTVLAVRRDGDREEPWTWVRQHGQGRVFYTAWGHDGRTWSNSGFQALVINGVRWASANSPNSVRARKGLPPFEYMEAPAPLPNYVAGARWGTQAEPIRTMQKPLDPEASLKHMATLPGFEIELFAAEPDIVKPIWLAWDERGRLWIAETIDYPNEMQPPGEGRDRLKICEDTDGDGRADRFTVFADQLSVPTSFVFANGGVIVLHSGKTEFFKDTDGDDRADERRVLFEGWGTGDTHAGPSNLRYGFDNWIWGVVGYSGFRGTVGGEELRFGQGIFRFKPDGSKMEFVRSSNNNTWGLGFSEDNIVFGSTANNNASMYMPIPNRVYEAVRGWSASRLESIADSQRFFPLPEHVRQVDWHGRYTAGAGSAIYTARQFPREYWNRVQFVAEPTGHLLGKFHLRPQGADFVAHNGRSFLASDDEWSSPIAAEVGPDGALWVLDWYNYIIQHNPTPNGFRNGRGNAYETPLRDKTHGRIQRVAYRGGSDARTAAAKRTPNLAGASPSQLVETLRSDNMLWRQHAQRLLVERGELDVVPALCALVKNKDVDVLRLNPAAIHALWTLHGLEAFERRDAREAAIEALAHPSPGVRRAAASVLPRTAENLEAVLNAGLLGDADPQVRLASLLALAEFPADARAAKAVLELLRSKQNSEDVWIRDAATAAAARNDAAFLREVLASHRPEPATTSASKPASTNLIGNSSFAEKTGDTPAGWRIVRYGGRAELTHETTGRLDSSSVRISSTQGTDASWTTRVRVRPGTDYRLTAWIRTEDVRALGNARGALINIHEFQDPENGATRPVVGTRDWTQVALDFNSGSFEELTINCLFGGWGRATGDAWFDDIELRPAPVAPGLAGGTGRVVRIVTAHYAQRGPVESIIPTLLALRGSSEELAVPILDGLVSGWPSDLAPELSESDMRALNTLMDAIPQSTRDRLLALARKWGRENLFGAALASIVAELKAQVADASAGDEVRVSAAQRLITLSDEPSTAALLVAQVDPLTPPQLATGLMNALTGSRHPDMAGAVIEHWKNLSPSARRAAVAALMRRTEWARALLEAVREDRISRADLAAEHWSQLKQNPDRRVSRLADRLSAPADSTAGDREEVVKRLLPVAQRTGNAQRGQEVFAANCAVCHTFNGQGGKVGPELTGIAARERTEILLEILDPNRSVEANYRLWSATTRDGDTISGRLEAETQTTVEMLDLTGQKHVLQRRELSRLDASPLSIMPTGFEALPEEDLAGLIEFLTKPSE